MICSLHPRNGQFRKRCGPTRRVWATPLILLADWALEVVALDKQLHVCRAPRAAEYLNIDPEGPAPPDTGRKPRSASVAV
jgi:hypothetical protein